MTARWSELGRRGGRHLGAVAWRLLLVLGLLELLYLVIANLVLWTPLLRKFAGEGDHVRLDYGSAYSVVPGRIEMRDLRFLAHDHNVEFSITLERGTLDVSLHELFRKRFHALRVVGDAVSYRMRHKLSKIGKEGRRVDAYPPIPGFPDPPLFRGPPPAPIPDAEYDLWSIDVENVTAHVKEIWILEYRYRGPGVARGGFRLQPTRYYDLPATTLDLSGGMLSLGRSVVSERTEAHLRVVVSGSDPRRLEGLEPLTKVVADARGTFEGTDLRFLDAYLEPKAGMAAGGLGSVDFDVHFAHGAFTPGSKVETKFSTFELSSKSFNVRAEKARVSARLEATPQGTRGRAELALTGATTALDGGHSGRFDMALTGEDLVMPTTDGKDPPSGAARLHVDRAPALLPLVTSSGMLRDLGQSLLGLRELDAYVRFRMGDAPLLDLREARAGTLRARGYYLARPRSPKGAFLFRTPVANLGLRITQNGTEWSPLVPDGWLDAEAAHPSGAQQSPGHGKASLPTD